MRIPLGNFGNVVAQPQQQVQVQADPSVARALGNVGQVGMQVAEHIKQEHEEMARVKGANADLDHKIFVKNKTQEISDKIARGEISYKDAAEAFRKDVESQPVPVIEGLPLVYQENLQHGFRRTVADAKFTIGKAVEVAQRAEFKGQFGAAIDKLSKLAGLPDADIEKINGQMDLLIPLAKNAGIPEDVLGKTIQDAKDRNWTNHATQRAMQAKDNLEGIQQLERDLIAADGFYAQKLDTDKRNAVLRSVINDRIRIENRMQHALDRRESKAERVIAEMDQQVASGIPMPQEKLLAWAERVKGTSFEVDFRQRIQDEAEVQQVLRMPIDQQMTFVQQKEAELTTKGGTVRDKANVTRLRTAVEKNIKQLQDEPLLFAQNRTGNAVEPLNLQSILDPGGAAELSNQMADRLATISALRKQYGTQVKMNPLLPQEAQLLTQVLDSAAPKQQSMLFGTLRASFNDDNAYLSTMRQIAPDSPVKALAGAIFAKQRGITLEKKWFGTDNVASSTNVAETLLVGESIVNKTKAQKAEDGVGKSMYLPPRNTFQTAFAKVAGDLYRGGRSAAQEIDLQAAYTYYVGRAAQTGRLTSTPTDIDSSLVKEAIAATVGEPINFNGRGMVTAPWGMSSESFKANATSAFVKAVKENGLPESLAYQFENYGLIHYRGSTYVPTMGGLPVINPKTGKPLVLDVGDSPINPGMKVPQ